MEPSVDLVILFKTQSGPALNKQHARDEAAQAQEQYSRLLSVLTAGGLKAAGRSGKDQSQLLVFVHSSESQLTRLVHRERHSDFVFGVTTSALPDAAHALDLSALTPAERLRLVYTYVTATAKDGGLGIAPEAPGWSRIESIMALHDEHFNETWIRSLAKTRQIGWQHLDTIRSEFGENVAFYFAFLVSYTQFLMPIALLGGLFFYLGLPYSPIFSSALVLWTTVFVETWRIRERIFAVRWNTLGSFRVEKRRASYVDGTRWWQRELRTLASVPVILVFAGLLFALLTAMFVFEAFVTTLYTGPGHEYIGFAPTVLFIALVPRFLGVYQKFAIRLTNWENHRHYSSHESSLTIKTFALSAIVAYLGLALSAFVYVPFGASIMAYVQQALDAHNGDGKYVFFDTAAAAPEKLNTARLQNQMFAYTVTNQIIGFVLENVLPFVQRFVSAKTSGGVLKNGSKASKKRVGFEDEAPRVGAERNFLERVRREAALPEYDALTDYAEMASQFGYVALWSTIWPLAAASAWVNNIIEVRSDAFKIVSHCRRPLPRRTDTIGPWLACLEAMAWAAALSNAALVYLFRPSTATKVDTALSQDTEAGVPTGPSQRAMTAALIALGASHGFLILRAIVRHILVRLLWRGSKEETRVEEADREVKEKYLDSVDYEKPVDGAAAPVANGGADADFWGYDEGQREILQALKDA
ncbi:DUF590-domain-containing protein [Peniophora sp. CONT]|nr:DUF590-domain-containing protein [Peniophora sp. CONT]